MKTKAVFTILIFFTVSFCANAQFVGGMFQLNMVEMGTFNLELKETNYVATTLAGDTIVYGNFIIVEGTISFTNEKGPQACPEGSVGKYTFSIQNKELKMELINDDCYGRQNILTQIWKQIDE